MQNRSSYTSGISGYVIDSSAGVEKYGVVAVKFWHTSITNFPFDYWLLKFWQF
jgi:hypothetical protein